MRATGKNSVSRSMAQGRRKADIAMALSIGESTVKPHIN
jgi:DNA-binding NarL/FixJ family response regulator